MCFLWSIIDYSPSCLQCPLMKYMHISVLSKRKQKKSHFTHFLDNSFTLSCHKSSCCCRSLPLTGLCLCLFLWSLLPSASTANVKSWVERVFCSGWWLPLLLQLPPLPVIAAEILYRLDIWLLLWPSSLLASVSLAAAETSLVDDFVWLSSSPSRVYRFKPEKSEKRSLMEWARWSGWSLLWFPLLPLLSLFPLLPLWPLWPPLPLPLPLPLLLLASVSLAAAPLSVVEERCCPFPLLLLLKVLKASLFA